VGPQLDKNIAIFTYAKLAGCGRRPAGGPALIRVTRNRLLALAAVLASGLASMGGCHITVGGGGSYGNLNLPVPYFSQGDTLLCGPTTVRMWRKYDGLSDMSSESLGDAMGCPWRTSGCSQNQIRYGAQAFTVTGYDAYVDDYGGVGDPDVLIAQFFSRQITSLANGVPVIALINGALHAVVPHAGNYTTASDGLKRWDYVYVQDPLYGGPDLYYVAGSWTQSVVQQIISSNAAVGWDGNYEEYGDMHVKGLVDWPPEGDWPPAI
jgi:hypothetical protein